MNVKNYVNETKLYVPKGPYIIQSERSPYRGRSIDELMFYDYDYFMDRLNDLKRLKSVNKLNAFHKHLLWLYERGKNRLPKMICPQCDTRHVRRFSVINLGFNNEISVDLLHTSCCHEDCIDSLLSDDMFHQILLFDFKFSNLLEFRSNHNRKKVINLYKEVFRLPKRITAKTAFEFFDEYSDEIFPEYI